MERTGCFVQDCALFAGVHFFEAKPFSGSGRPFGETRGHGLSCRIVQIVASGPVDDGLGAVFGRGGAEITEEHA